MLRQRVVDLVSPLQEPADLHQSLLTVFLGLDRVHGAAVAAHQGHVELGELAEAARVAQERVALVVVDGAALVALEHVLAAGVAHARVGGHGGRAARALQQGGLGVGLGVAVVEVHVLDHEVAGDDGQLEVDLNLGLRRQHAHLLSEKEIRE